MYFFFPLFFTLVVGQWSFDPRSDEWKAIQPDPAIPFNTYLPHSARIYGSLFLLPNYTDLGLALDRLIIDSLSGLANRTDIHFPLNEFFEAMFDSNKSFPELIEGQSGPLPVWDDFYCNPQFFPNGCASLDEIGAAVGIPFGHFLQGGIPFHLQRATGVMFLNLYDRMIRGITPSLVLYAQQDHRIAGTVGAARHVLVPLLDYPENGPLHTVLANLTNLMLWDRLEHADGPDTTREYIMESSSQLARAAAACRAFNGRLPYCDALLPYDAPAPPLPQEIREPNHTLDSHGFRLEVKLNGFRESCEHRADSCVIGGNQLNPEEFDGIYQLAGVDDLGFPLYVKRRVHFEAFTKIHRLYLRVAGYVGPKWPGGVAMIITPNLPDLTTINVEAQSPFVLVLGEPTSCKTATDFPMCASNWRAPSSTELSDKLSYSKQGTAGWYLARGSGRGCPVPRDRVSGYCILRLSVTVS